MLKTNVNTSKKPSAKSVTDFPMIIYKDFLSMSIFHICKGTNFKCTELTATSNSLLRSDQNCLL